MGCATRLIFSACGHFQVTQEPTRKLFSFLVNVCLHFQKIVDFVNFLVVQSMYRALKIGFFINFLDFLCLESFHDPLRVAVGTLKTFLSTFPNNTPSRLLGNQVIRLFLRTYFEFQALKNATWACDLRKKTDFCPLWYLVELEK